jgi:hypothetical protein
MGTRVRIWAAGTRAAAGKRVQRVFSKKKLIGPSQTIPVYPFTHLYPDTDTDTAGTGYGYTGTGCTRRVLANP